MISLLPPSLFRSTSITVRVPNSDILTTCICHVRQVLGLGDNKICSLPPALTMMTQLQCSTPFPNCQSSMCSQLRYVLLLLFVVLVLPVTVILTALELLGNPLAASFIACLDRERYFLK